MRHLCRTNLFYLLTVVLKRTDADNEWLYDRCKEVYDNPDNHLDLWSRGHYKSTIITYAKTIQDILRSYGNGAVAPFQRTFAIFSHTRPIATAFAMQIKYDFEANESLRALFPDIFWANPKRDAPQWSNTAFVVRGASARNCATVEAWGLVDSQPTSKHFDVRVYNDTVVELSVSTPEQIAKTTKAWELSLNLGSTDGVARYEGTKYAVHDTYKVIANRGGVKVRRHPASHDGTLTGKAVFWPQKLLEEKIRTMGTATAACQLMQDPKAAEELGFERSDLRFYQERPNTSQGSWKIYILVDPANTKNKKSDWSAIGVIAVGMDGNYYVLELIRDKLSLTERAKMVMALHRQYRPHAVGYEVYGMQADIDHLKAVQEREQYRFEVTPLGGNKISKHQRIQRLGPLLEDHKLYFPPQQFRTLYDGRRVDVIAMFLEDEFDPWPVAGKYEDCLDMLSRITDSELGVLPPQEAWNATMAQTKRSEKRVYDWIY